MEKNAEVGQENSAPNETVAPNAGALYRIRDKEQWRLKYRETFEEVARIEARELAAMTEEEALRQIRALRTCEAPWNERPDWSGLVEQQAIFHRRRKP